MLTKKNAIVTGSTSGIGLAIAHALAEEGCNIMLNGMGEKSAIDQEIGNFKQQYKEIKIDYSPADMSKSADIAGMIAQCEKTFGSCDILVNNAGIQFTAPFDEFPDDKWNAIIAINLSATFHAIKAALPGMKKKDYGRIINIASVHGLVASVNKAAYVAAKHGVVGLTKVAAIENGEANITVNAICPGWVHTPLVQKQIEDNAKKDCVSVEQATKTMLQKQPNRKFIKPENIAAMIVFLCGEHGDSMTGEMISMDGGWLAE